MSKSIQERVKHLENVVKSCCNRFFKLKEQVDTLESNTDAALDLKADLTGATFTGNISAPNFKSQGLQTLTGVAWTGTTAPSGTANLSYIWQRNGNLVTVAFTGIYTVAGSALTAVRIQLPTDMPTPIRPTGVSTTASSKVYAGLGQISTSLVTLGTTLQPCFIVNNATDITKFDVLCGGSSTSAITFYLAISYFTS